MAPSSLCSVMKTTVRAKLGSTSAGEAIKQLAAQRILHGPFLHTPHSAVNTPDPRSADS